MNVKTVVVILGGVTISIAVADLLLGNTPQAILPDFLGNALTQNIDIFLILLAAAAMFLTVRFA